MTNFEPGDIAITSFMGITPARVRVSSVQGSRVNYNYLEPTRYDSGDIMRDTGDTSYTSNPDSHLRLIERAPEPTTNDIIVEWGYFKKHRRAFSNSELATAFAQGLYAQAGSVNDMNSVRVFQVTENELAWSREPSND
jgi:hypothetical protein